MNDQPKFPIGTMPTAYMPRLNYRQRKIVQNAVWDQEEEGTLRPATKTRSLSAHRERIYMTDGEK